MSAFLVANMFLSEIQQMIKKIFELVLEEKNYETIAEEILLHSYKAFLDPLSKIINSCKLNAKYKAKLP